MQNTEQWLAEDLIAHQDEYIRTLEDTISKISIEIKILQNKIKEISHMMKLMN